MEVTIRELTALDLAQGFLETLAHLAEMDLPLEQAREVFRTRLRTGIHTYVALDGEQVIGTVSLVVEQKFIHGGACCGHIEDVVVHPDHNGRGVGSALVRHANEEAKKFNCYKVILNCYDKLVPFYERLGYRRHDVGMRINL